MAGLEAWAAVRSGNTAHSGCLAHLAAIRRLLHAGKKPDSLPPETWTAYLGFLADADAQRMVELIMAVEWSTGAPDLVDERSRLTAMLRKPGGATSDAEAQQQYSALFVHVFHALCRPGVKRLSTSDRDAILSKPTLSDGDTTLLNQVVAAVGRL
ncbi:MAG: hypothetical protein ACHREM_22690, partial [Polyangiales bacterium]